MTRVCRRVERAGLAGAHLAVILRDEDGQPAPVRRGSAEEATTRPEVWLPIARELLHRAPVPPLSRLGVTLAGLVPADQIQGALF